MKLPYLKSAVAEYQNFVKTAWNKVVNHKDKESIPQEEFIFLKEANGIWHFTGTQQFRHVYKHHGNEKAEKARGQIAITAHDFYRIPDIISNYSFMLENVTYQCKNSVLYAKHDAEGTYVYIEQISIKRRRKTTATFFKFAKQKDAKDLITILQNNNNYDVRAAKIIGLGEGGNPPDTPAPNHRRTEATSVNPADTSLSPS